MKHLGYAFLLVLVSPILIAQVFWSLIKFQFKERELFGTKQRSCEKIRDDGLRSLWEQASGKRSSFDKL